MHRADQGANDQRTDDGGPCGGHRPKLVGIVSLRRRKHLTCGPQQAEAHETAWLSPDYRPPASPGNRRRLEPTSKGGPEGYRDRPRSQCISLHYTKFNRR